MLFCYNENIITVWEKYLFNNQDTQGYRRQDVVWGGVDKKHLPTSFVEECWFCYYDSGVN